MKNRFYHGCMMLITALMMLSFVLIITRLLAKEILIDQLDLDNEAVSLMADYYWGDRLAFHPEENNFPGNSVHYTELRDMYDDVKEVREVPNAEEPDSGASEGPRSVINEYTDRYVGKVNEFENDMNHYCNYHFILRPYLTDLKLACYDAVGWNMVFARNDGDEFMLKNGVICQAEQLCDDIEIDTTLKEIADDKGIQYLFIQYPYRLSSVDTYVPYGAENHVNENIDKRLQEMRNIGIEVMDLRSELYAAGWDGHEGFYLSDNHWKTESGFMAAKLISEYLESHYDGFLCNEEMHDPTAYDIIAVDLRNPMLREEVDIFNPSFATSFELIGITDDHDRDTEKSGEFYDTLYDPVKIEGNHFSSVLTVYSASNVGFDLTEIVNCMDTPHHGTVIYVSNSFSWHVIPYLAMDCDRVYYVPYTKKEYVSMYIEALQPDIIVEANQK